MSTMESFKSEPQFSPAQPLPFPFLCEILFHNLISYPANQNRTIIVLFDHNGPRNLVRQIGPSESTAHCLQTVILAELTKPFDHLVSRADQMLWSAE